MELTKFLKTEMVMVENKFYEQSEEVDNYLKDKIREYLKSEGYEESSDGTYIMYVYNDYQDWESLHDIFNQYNPSTKEDFIDILFETCHEGMQDAIDLVESYILKDIKEYCLSEEEIKYLEDTDMFELMNEVYYAIYNMDEVWNTVNK